MHSDNDKSLQTQLDRLTARLTTQFTENDYSGISETVNAQIAIAEQLIASDVEMARGALQSLRDQHAALNTKLCERRDQVVDELKLINRGRRAQQSYSQ
ncbi:MAG: hypothetical protein AAF384_02745 [Pseudomonadota bacterium]